MADWMQEVPGINWVPFAGGWCFVDSSVADGAESFVLANNRTIESLTNECMMQGVNLMLTTGLSASSMTASASWTSR